MERKKYNVPTVEQIKIDREITLQLESLSPPFGPDESKLGTQKSALDQSPFRDIVT